MCHFEESCFFNTLFSQCIESQQARRINRNEANDAQIPRRAQIARNQRRNAPNQASNAPEDSENSDGEPDRPSPFAEGAKIGTKKRAKLEAKAEKRIQREQEQIAREDKKKRDAAQEVERKKAEQAVEVSSVLRLDSPMVHHPR